MVDRSARLKSKEFMIRASSTVMTVGDVKYWSFHHRMAGSTLLCDFAVRQDDCVEREKNTGPTSR